MLRFVCLSVGLLAAMLAGCGTPTDPSAAFAPAAFGDPLVIQVCERNYHNEAFGFAFNAPDGAAGPDIAAPSDKGNTLFSADWTTQTGRVFQVNINNIGTLSFEDALAQLRQLAANQQMQLLDDRPLALDSGRVGWLFKLGIANGPTLMHVFDVRRGYLFNISVDISGIRAAELDTVQQTLQSFCIDP